MDIQTAGLIITHAVRVTQPRWSEYEQSWKNVDRLFIQHGYEQQGFQIFKLVPVFEKNGIYSIDAIGSIWKQSRDPEKYISDYARGLDSPFYHGLKSNQRGKTGTLLYESIYTFLTYKLGSPGRSFWQLIWYLLVACSYLKRCHNSSFSEYIKNKYKIYSGLKTVSDDVILNLSSIKWEAFKNSAKPWNELKGIGPSTFDFIFRDMTEANFAPSLFKFDSSNMRFLNVTGISNIMPSKEHGDIVNLLETLPTPYSLGEINKGIYTFCSRTESEGFGFCRSYADCRRCGISEICDRIIS